MFFLFQHLLIFIKFILLLLLIINNVISLPNIEECITKSLGMESGKIKDEQLIASSSFDPLSTSPINARLNTESGSGAWCPASQINATSHEWIQIELTKEYMIVGVSTQGRWDKGRGLEFSSAYMIEYWRPSLGRWARYKDSYGNEIILANSNTQTAVLRLLDGGIIAKLIRLIPVSESIRTVCLRFELYGCLYKEPLVSYSAPSGAIVDALDLRDLSYDGWTVSPLTESSESLNSFSDIIWMRGGLGHLFDGKKGNDNFEESPNNWIGWHKSQKLGPFIPIEFIFTQRQNLSAILLYTSNFRRRGARIFSSVRLHFSLLGGEFSSRIIEKNFPEDSQFENSRWVRIPIPQRIASRLRIEIFFDQNSDWLLLSEVLFEIESFNNYDLIQKQQSSLFYENNEDIDISEDNNNIINLWPFIENCYLLIIVIFFGTFISLITFFICLRSLIFSSRRKRRQKQKQLSPTNTSSINYSNNGSSSLTSNNKIINSSSSLKHSKSLLLQQLLQGAKRKMEVKKCRLGSSQSHILLKLPFDSINDKEQQNELIDIANLVLQHNKNNNKILNDNNESQYADLDDINLIQNCNNNNFQKELLFPTATIKRPSTLLHYATSRDLLINNRRRPNNNIFDEFEEISRTESPTNKSDFLSSQQRYFGTPTMDNFSPSLIPPPIPLLPPPPQNKK